MTTGGKLARGNTRGAESNARQEIDERIFHESSDIRHNETKQHLDLNMLSKVFAKQQRN